EPHPHKLIARKDWKIGATRRPPRGKCNGGPAMADWQQSDNVWTRGDGVRVTLNPNSHASFVWKADKSLVLGTNGAPRPFRSVDDALAFAEQTFPRKSSGWGFGLRR